MSVIEGSLDLDLSRVRPNAKMLRCSEAQVFPKPQSHQGLWIAPPARLERATYGLEVRRSIRLSYGGSADGFYPTGRAGDGSRTRVTSLEGWGSTIELHPLTPP